MRRTGVVPEEPDAPSHLTAPQLATLCGSFYEVYDHAAVAAQLRRMKIPAAVKVMFGTDIKQLGFNVTYRKVTDELWFPATYGTEFYLKVLFGYKRNITMNVTNSDFRKASAESSIQFETEK